MASAQCERFFYHASGFKARAAEDTAGSVRRRHLGGDIRRGHRGRRAAEQYRGVILAEAIQDNAGKISRASSSRFQKKTPLHGVSEARKISLAMRPPPPGALLASSNRSPNTNVNLLKIEQPPIPATLGVSVFHRRRSRRTSLASIKPSPKSAKHERTPRPRPHAAAPAQSHGLTSLPETTGRLSAALFLFSLPLWVVTSFFSSSCLGIAHPAALEMSPSSAADAVRAAPPLVASRATNRASAYSR